ncbi:MAG: hypothetical protein M3044_12965 [Thermoproteota archaeon]|nr:hypothetical protein [Thermoproteota archaeon]
MTSISKNHTSYTVLVALATLAVVLLAGAVASHQVAFAKGAVGSHQMAFDNKRFFMAFPLKRVGAIGGSTGDNGKQAIAQPTNNDQRALCLTTGGNSPISGSCTNAATTTTNTGGIGAIGGSAGDNGKQAIAQPTNNNQRGLCLTVGGNSPVTGSCLQIGGSTTTNMGGLAGVRP